MFLLIMQFFDARMLCLESSKQPYCRSYINSCINDELKTLLADSESRVQWLNNLEIPVLVRSLKSSNVELG